MAVLQKEFNVMGLPMAISRNNPIPLDKTAVWYDEAQMREYAATNPTAYVGQVLSLVNETTRTATAYIITSVAGALKEVGAAVLVDERTIVLSDDSKLGLNDFEKSFYKYIPATETKEAHYIKVNVGDLDAEGKAYTWASGLEPKAVLENGEFVLGWYEPNPTTIEGVNAAVTALQNSVNSINGEITALENADKEINTAINLIKNDIADRYTKGETDKAIGDAIAAIDHLTREVVTELPAVADADPNVIYMVPSGLTADDNKYYEWMLINGAFEQVGSWEVDLSAYAKKTDLDGKVDVREGYSLVADLEIAKLATVHANAEENFIKSAGSEFNVDDNGNVTLVAVPNNIDLSQNETVKLINTGLGTKVTAEEGYSLVSDELIEKLDNLPDDAEKNVINAVNETEFQIDENRTLSIVSVAATKITDLASNAEFADVLSAVSSLNDDLGDTIESLASLGITVNSNAAAITTLTSDLSTLTGRVSDAEIDIAALQDALTWKDLEE